MNFPDQSNSEQFERFDKTILTRFDELEVKLNGRLQVLVLRLDLSESSSVSINPRLQTIDWHRPKGYEQQVPRFDSFPARNK